MKILFVHEVSYSKKPVFEMHEFPELLSRGGHDVTFFEFDEGRKFWQRGQSKLSSRVRGRIWPELEILIERPYQLGIPGIDRLFAVLSSIPRLWWLVRSQNYDVIVLYAVPTYGLQTITIAKAYGTPLLFRALDVSHKIRSSVFSPLIRLVEKFLYRNAGSLSVNNPAMADYCVKLAARDIVPLVHLPPLSLEHFQRRTNNVALRGMLGITESDKVMVYMGSFFYFSGLNEALRSFARHAQTKSDLKFLLIGGGEQSSELRELAKTLKIADKVIFTGFVSYWDLPDYLSLGHVAINTLTPSLVANTALPNKVLQYLASGLPVVSTRLNGLRSLFSESTRVSWCATSSEVVDIAQEMLFDDSFLPTKQEALASISSLERFDYKATLRVFESVLLELGRVSPTFKLKS